MFFAEIDVRKNDVVEPIGETCVWILKHRVYLRWLDAHRGLLWLKGKPGAGKSTLLRYIWKQQKAQDMLITASFFFHGRGASIQKSLLGLFRSLLFQILQCIPDSLSSFSALFRRKCDTQGKAGEDWEWQANELKELFKTYITSAIKTHSVQIFVDALDECGEETATCLVDFFQQLMDELPHTKTSLRICFSCRYYPLVASESGFKIRVEAENRQDIEIYVYRKLENGIPDKAMSTQLQADILRRSQGVFQWVVLVVPRVILLDKKGKSLSSIQKALQQIPTELNELYQELLQEIDENEKPQSLRLMQWICFACRPLSLTELRVAMAVEEHPPHDDSLSECKAAEEFVDSDEKMKKRINDLSKGLAEVIELEDRQFVQFVHQSVGDYLIPHGLRLLTNGTIPDDDDVVGSAHIRPDYNDVVRTGHFQLMRTCLRYKYMRTHEKSFSRYARLIWHYHAKVVEPSALKRLCRLKPYIQSLRDRYLLESPATEFS